MSCVSSPHSGPRRSALSSKGATPELSAIEGAIAGLAHLDEMGLLPAAATDFGSEPQTPTTALPPTPIPLEDEPDSLCNGANSGLGTTSGWYELLCCELRPMDEGRMMVVPIWDEDYQMQVASEAVIELWCWIEANTEGCLVAYPSSYGAIGGPFLPAESCYVLNTEAQVAADWLGGGFWDAAAMAVPLVDAMPPLPTTFQVADLPEALTQEDFIEFLDREEGSGLYDFVFMPTISATENRFAVVNCVSHQGAMELGQRLQCRSFWGNGMNRECRVSWTQRQGMDELTEMCHDAPENAKDVDDAIRPQVFLGGTQEPLPRKFVIKGGEVHWA